MPDRATEVLRSDDPLAAMLLADGWVVVAESWGARLRMEDLPAHDAALGVALGVALAAVDRARAAGYEVRELDDRWASGLYELERANHSDYPAGPATSVPDRSPSDIAGLWEEYRVFGAVQGGELVAATVIGQHAGRAETQFTSVLGGHRRRGLAVAVKAASIVALVRDGARVFGTGGAASNAGSIRMNEHLGYVIEERWLSLTRG